MNTKKLFKTIAITFSIFLSISAYAKLTEAPVVPVVTTKKPGFEMTLVLLKPDCIEKKIVGDVISRFENYGLAIRGIKITQLSNAILKEHYAHLAQKDFFPELLAFMSSSPVIVMVLEGENAIEEVRNLIGSTDPLDAKLGTIRSDYGDDKMHNIIHASDSPTNAEIEINRFFNPEEIFE